MAKQSLYSELMDKHNIVSIMGGSDLALDPATGGLMMGKRGDLMWQGRAHNAMFQFVRSFEMNVPNLKTQFAKFVESFETEASLVKASNKHAEELAKKMLNNYEYGDEEMHALSDAIGAAITGREGCAASIFITLNTMLQTLKDELEVDQQKCQQCSPLYSAQSFGNVVWAASNNARHADEWRVEWVANKAFTPQQLKSVKVLAPVLGREVKDYRFLAGEICAEVLMAVSNKDFEVLERSLFIYVNNLAAGVENIKP